MLLLIEVNLRFGVPPQKSQVFVNHKQQSNLTSVQMFMIG